MRSYSSPTLLVVVFLLTAGLSVSAQTFFQHEFPDVNTLPDGMNDLGVIVGHLGDEAGGKIGFVRSTSGRFTTFLANNPKCPGNLGSTWPKGINNRGDVVGTVYCPYEENPDVAPGFVRTRNGRISLLKDPHGNWASATAINDFGFIVGSITKRSGAVVGFIRNSKGDYAYLPRPKNVQIWPRGINNAGTVVGSYVTVDPFNGQEVSRRGFIYKNGVYKIYNFGPQTEFLAITNITEDVLVAASVPTPDGQARSYWVRHKSGARHSLNSILATQPFRAFKGINVWHSVTGSSLESESYTMQGFVAKNAY